MSRLLHAAARRNNMLTTERLRHMLNYDPDTGEFTWRVDAGRWGAIKAGTKAGATMGNGYLCIGLDGKNYSAHRLAWQHYYGDLPPNYIDHINRVKTDNRIANLREADKSQNAQNTSVRADNKTGFRGVVRQGAKFSAKIMFSGRQISLGTFKTAKEASEFYEAVAAKLFTHYEGL